MVPARYDVHTVHYIINSAPVAHVAFINPETLTPVVLPMIARIGAYEPAPRDVADQGADGEAMGNGHAIGHSYVPTVACYLHGSAQARLFRQSQEVVSQEGGMGGIPICIEATKILGLVLSHTPYSHAYDYRSAVVHGRATVLNPEESAEERREVLWALRLLTDGILPGRWDNSREPDDFEIMSTLVLKVTIDSASAKVRSFGVDEEPKDLNDWVRRDHIWTGVIPYLELLGEPQPASTNRVLPVPSYIEEHVQKHNASERARSRVNFIIWGGNISDLIIGIMAWLLMW